MHVKSDSSLHSSAISGRASCSHQRRSRFLSFCQSGLLHESCCRELPVMMNVLSWKWVLDNSAIPALPVCRGAGCLRSVPRRECLMRGKQDWLSRTPFENRCQCAIFSCSTSSVLIELSAFADFADACWPPWSRRGSDHGGTKGKPCASEITMCAPTMFQISHCMWSLSSIPIPRSCAVAVGRGRQRSNSSILGTPPVQGENKVPLLTSPVSSCFLTECACARQP